MTSARQRQDLLDADMFIPYIETTQGVTETLPKTRYVRLGHWIEGSQDESGLGEFYTDFGTFLTIDLEFKP